MGEDDSSRRFEGARPDGGPRQLSPAATRFILHWGEMGTRWGVNRTVAQIHALLHVSTRPLDAEEISERLQVARSNVSTSLRELQRWGIVTVVHKLGDRRDYFQSMQDPWELFKLILEERKRREIDPTLQVLTECLDETGGEEPLDPAVRERLQTMLDLFQTFDSWYQEVVKLSSGDLERLARMGRQVKRLLRFEA